MENLCYYKQVPARTEYLGEFPSGQRGQTVNLLLIASVVRIHLPPPIKRGHPWGVLFLLVSKADSNPIKSTRPVACWKNQFANWFSPYCFAVQSKPSNPPSPTKHKKSELFPCGGWVRIFLFISRIFHFEFCASSAGLMPGCWHLFYFLFQFIELLCRAVRKLYYNLSEYR